MISAKEPTMATLRGMSTKQLPLPSAAREQPADSVDTAVPPVETPEFHPKPVETIEAMNLSHALVESLLFKHLLAVGHNTGRGIASAIAVPPDPIIELLAKLKSRQLVYYRASTAIGDFEYALTDAGRARAKGFLEECSYAGPAPVTLKNYIASVRAQSITLEKACKQDLQKAFEGLLINEHMFQRLGPAINSGRGLFLYGFPGNGKTSIAERITGCFGGNVWIPHAIYAAGELITFYDPQNHEAVKSDMPKTLRTRAVDPRWIHIKRPTIVVGGELTMDSLDLKHHPQTRITEPSLQLKSNTGTLVIDDFGRQRMRPVELLNRWIVPLEKRYDFLTLANGKKIRVPFDQLIIFSTNLEPKDLVDDAFLRRIPYKINVKDPTEQEFRKLFQMTAPILEVEVSPHAIDTLIDKHYKAVNRSFRCCHPRDLLLQIKNSCVYHNTAAIASEEAFDAAVENYFAVM